MPAKNQGPILGPRSSKQVAHIHSEFNLTVHAPYKAVTPLFGPEGERSWGGGHWDPRFLHPRPASDIQGAVFTISNGDHQSLWIMTILDVEAGHFQYVQFVPDVLVTLIDVVCSEPEPPDTKVKVVYERTALSPEHNKQVRALGALGREMQREWSAAINGYFAYERRKGSRREG